MGWYDDDLQAGWHAALKGEKLTPEQKQAFAAEARSLLNSQLESQSEQDNRYSALAKSRNLKVEEVLDPTFGNIRTSLSERDKALAAPTPPSPKTAGKQGGAVPGTIVRLKDGSQATVGPDGDSLIPIVSGGR